MISIASFITLVSFVNELITLEWQRDVRNIAKEVVSAMKEAKSLTKSASTSFMNSTFVMI